jgi:4-diphosphocytidyl-2-C-methyl-D-erythritol kinase
LVAFVKQLSSTEVVIGAPAKINLYLEILNRRADNFHNIKSAFQAVSLFDRLRVTRIDSPTVQIEMTGQWSAPTDESNLITRAFRLIQTRHSVSGGISVHVDKQIPVGGGLGGGSSDAAATLVACNLLFSLGLGERELAELGAQLGSDVPFFFSSGQADVRGRGELITPLTLTTDYWLTLVTPSVGISTPQSYAQLKRGLTHADSGFTLPPCQSVGELIEALRLTGNDFECNHLKNYPILDRVRTALIDSGALMVRMSGSGSTFFGIYGDAPGAVGRQIAGDDWYVTDVRPVTIPTHSS